MDDQFWNIVDYNYPDNGEYNAMISRTNRIIRNAEDGICPICGNFYEDKECPEHNNSKIR